MQKSADNSINKKESRVHKSAGAVTNVVKTKERKSANDENVVTVRENEKRVNEHAVRETIGEEPIKNHQSVDRVHETGEKPIKNHKSVDKVRENTKAFIDKKLAKESIVRDSASKISGSKTHENSENIIDLTIDSSDNSLKSNFLYELELGRNSAESLDINSSAETITLNENNSFALNFEKSVNKVQTKNLIIRNKILDRDYFDIETTSKNISSSLEVNVNNTFDEILKELIELSDIVACDNSIYCKLDLSRGRADANPSDIKEAARRFAKSDDEPKARRTVVETGKQDIQTTEDDNMLSQEEAEEMSRREDELIKIIAKKIRIDWKGSRCSRDFSVTRKRNWKKYLPRKSTS